MHFLGPVRDLENFYAAADLFVLLPIYEPSANVCIEAMSAGLPVITTRYNGASEVMNPGHDGSIVGNPADAREVADAIAHWHSRWQQMRPARLPAPEGLDLDRNVNETIAVLERAVRERTR